MTGQISRAYLGIGEVLVELRAEFPDISVSKIRFLETEGLIAPARTPSGYRRFSAGDLDRLRYILTAQRDEYLPLRVIRERLSGGRQLPAIQSRPERTELISASELMAGAGIDQAQLAELEAHGLIRRVGRLYGQEALDVAGIVTALAAYGVQARHLRPMRSGAEREMSLIEQVIAPTLRQRSPQARETAGRTAGEIGALLLGLHRAMIDAALAESGLPGAQLPLDQPIHGQPLASRPLASQPRSAGYRGASA